jgi:hypothetical protein
MAAAMLRLAAREEALIRQQRGAKAVVSLMVMRRFRRSWIEVSLRRSHRAVMDRRAQRKPTESNARRAGTKWR